MEIKIKNNNEYIPATLEVVDGVMIVSPVKEDKVGISQFKDGDIAVCGDGDSKNIFIFKDNSETYPDFCHVHAVKIGKNVCLNELKDGVIEHGIVLPKTRLANDDEIKELLDALEKDGYRWDAEKKEVVELRWKPKVGQPFYYPRYQDFEFKTTWYQHKNKDSLDDDLDIKRGWVFPTGKECEAYCDKLNNAIKDIKP